MNNLGRSGFVRGNSHFVAEIVRFSRQGRAIGSKRLRVRHHFIKGIDEDGQMSGIRFMVHFISVRELSKQPGKALQKVATVGPQVITQNSRPSALLIPTSGRGIEADLDTLQRLLLGRALDATQAERARSGTSACPMEAIEAEIAAALLAAFPFRDQVYPGKLPALPDPSDEVFLAAALATETKVFVTGNASHFPANICVPVQILTPAEALLSL